MRHKVAGRKFGRPTAQRIAMYRIMVTDLLRHGHLTTTVNKAREIQPMAEKMVTLGKSGTLHDRRLAAEFITDSKVVAQVFGEIGPRFKERAGGYTRLTKLGVRPGDAAQMAVLELVE